MSMRLCIGMSVCVFSALFRGDGGVLDMQEAELTRMAGDDWKKREAVKMAAWIRPKMAHKHMVQRLLQVRAHLILCFRAEEKIEMVRGKDGKMEIVKKQTATGLDGWVPISEKNLPYELTASFLLTDERPGVPLPIKLQEQHRALFPLDKPITEESGRLIAEWSAGGQGASQASDHDPYKALAACESVAALQAVFKREWVAASQDEKPAIKKAYDARLSQLQSDDDL
jgi:hypothetical protein